MKQSLLKILTRIPENKQESFLKDSLDLFTARKLFTMGTYFFIAWFIFYFVDFVIPIVSKEVLFISLLFSVFICIGMGFLYLFIRVDYYNKWIKKGDKKK